MGERGWIVVTMLVGALAACRSTTLEDSIVGMWRNDEGGTKMLWLFEDGTFATEAPVGAARGRYQVEDGKLRMEYDNRSAEMVISVSEDKLTLCQPEATRCDAYQKVK